MKLSIKNFKSIKEVELDLNSINVLIGTPNSGKSNILEAVYLYGTIKREYFFETFKFLRMKELTSLEIKAEGYDMLKISYSNLNFPFTILYRYENFLLAGEKGWKFPSYLLPGFENLNYIITERYPAIKEYLIEKYNPFLERWGIKFKSVQSVNEVRFEIEDIDAGITYTLFDLKSLAQSIQYLLLFSSAILANKEFSQSENEDVIVLLEEPDAHMFPTFIEEFCELLRDVSKEKNLFIILTTHNENTLLNIIDKINKNNLNVFGVVRENKYTKVEKLDIDKLRDKYIETGLGEFIRNIENIINEIKKD
ncbi:MAG: AAA family ATPase [Candidatus Aenigmatarchaeota archaeon]